MNRIIQNTDWYEELKDLRDKPIVHRGDKDSAIATQGERVGIHLLYIQDQDIRETFISNMEIKHKTWTELILQKYAK